MPNPVFANLTPPGPEEFIARLPEVPAAEILYDVQAGCGCVTGELLIAAGIPYAALVGYFASYNLHLMAEVLGIPLLTLSEWPWASHLVAEIYPWLTVDDVDDLMGVNDHSNPPERRANLAVAIRAIAARQAA